MPDPVSKGFNCFISRYDHWNNLPGAEIDAKLGRAALQDLDAGSVTKTLEGHVTFDCLKRGFTEVVQDLERAEDLPEFPVLLSLVSCHAVQIGDRTFPHLVPSDAPPIDDEEFLKVAFDIQEHFIEPLNNLKFRSQKTKKLRAILVLDCCRSMLSHRGPPHFRNFVTSLKHDFYVIFSCDQGRKSWDARDGGALMRVLLPTLKYRKYIHDIFVNACCQVTCQRPNDCNRAGRPVPILGSVVGDPLGWELVKQDEQDDDLNKVVVVVLSGITGHGKSTLGNFLSGNESFEVGSGLFSKTMSAKHMDFQLDRVKYRIIDTVGFNDTSLSMEENWTRFAQFVDRAPVGFDAFLHVVQWGPFTEDNLRALKCLQEAAGEGCNSHILLVFSKAPHDFHEHIEKGRVSNPHLEEALQIAKNNFAGVNCDGAEAEKVRQMIIAKVQSLVSQNHGRKHTNDLVRIADTTRAELFRMIQLNQLNAPGAHEVREVIQKLYHGNLSSLEALDQARGIVRQQAQQQPAASTAPVSDSQDTPAAFAQVFDAFKVVGACAQAQADRDQRLLPQLFTRGWTGAVNLMAEKYGQEAEKEKVDQNQVNTLKEMGFSEDCARLALEKHKDLQAACEWLLSQSTRG